MLFDIHHDAAELLRDVPEPVVVYHKRNEHQAYSVGATRFLFRLHHAVKCLHPIRRKLDERPHFIDGSAI